MKNNIITTVLCIGFLLFGASAAQAAICTVNVFTDNSVGTGGAGGGGASGAGDLRYCITQTNAAGGADNINVSGSGTVLLSANLPYISDSLTINGGNQFFFIIDAQNQSNRRGFEVDAPAGVTVNINNLTIQNGNITSSGIGSGAGISLISGATLNVNGVRILNNNSVDGGAAIFANGSVLNVTNSTITRNNSTSPGAGAGGINVFSSTFFMTNATVSNNTASNGGGLTFFQTNARVENSTISGNTASRGGGVYNAVSNVLMSNVTIINNTATDLGGALVNSSNNSSTLFRNCTVAGNRAANFGGGYYGFGGSNIVLTIANTIFADNSATFGADIYNSNSSILLREGANIIKTAVDGGGGIGGGGSVIQSDPLLFPPGINGGVTETMSFAANSPARNAGVNSEALNTLSVALTNDQRGSGYSRIVSGTVDIGAYELSTATVTKTADTNDGVCDADCSLREAVATVLNGGVVSFSTLFDIPQTITVSSPITTNKSVAISGPGANKLTVSGGGTNQVFTYFGGTTYNITFAGMTIANGNGTGGHNTNQGGAMEMNGGLTNLNFDGVILRNNTASALGGVVLFIGGACRIKNSTIINNSSPMVSGIYMALGSSLEITNSTISGNSTTNFGTFYSDVANVTVNNSTIVNNTGGGLYKSAGTMTLTNSIVAGNGGYDIYRAAGTVATNGGNLIGRNTSPGTSAGANFTTAGMPNASGDYVGTNAAPINPQLAPLDYYGGTTPTHALLQNSPALNHGIGCVVSNSCPTVLSVALSSDQRGIPRQIGGAVDIGAFETSITIDPASLPNGSPSVSYSQQFSAVRQTGLAENFEQSSKTQNLAPTNFEIVPVAGQSLPPGITFSTDGLLSGIPTTAGTYTFSIKATDTDGIAGVQQYTIQILAPTAANVSVSGRVLTANGSGIRNVIIKLTDTNGNSRTVQSGTFGNFSFANVQVGETYVISVESKRFIFSQSSQIVSVNDDLTNIDFISQE